MSLDALPISPARFAEAIKDLSLPSLHLKVLEIRNSIAHLDYSNEQLRPFAEGTEPVLGSSAPGQREQEREQQQQPDQDCIDAIRENEQVIGRMQDRIRLIRAEIEGRGFNWTEFQSKEEVEAEQAAAAASEHAPLTNGDSHADVNGGQDTGDAGAGATGTQRARDPWTDGTFQTGTIRNGEVHIDAAHQSRGGGGGGPGQGGGSLTDEQLRRALEERLRETQLEDDDEEDGVYL